MTAYLPRLSLRFFSLKTPAYALGLSERKVTERLQYSLELHIAKNLKLDIGVSYTQKIEDRF